MKFYELPTCLCRACKGPTKVTKVLFSASDKVCITVRCLHCRKEEDCVLSVSDIAALYYKCESKTDSLAMKGDDSVVH